MPDIKTVLSEEIRRLAKKEIKLAIVPLQKLAAEQRRTISELKKRIAVLEKQAAPAEKAAIADNTAATGAEEKKLRLNAAGIIRVRTKLKLTQSDFAKLLNVSTHTVSMWELDKSAPRKDARAAICALRKLGKRELKARMAAFETKAE
jgi:DNA-binding transcriptional regulator YiaG